MSGIDRRVGMRLAAAACLSVVAFASPAAAQDVLRFGLAMPLTGSQALYGQDQVKAAEWAVAAINAVQRLLPQQPPRHAVLR